MAATNFTPIILYHSVTASAAPTAGNLNNGELAINITDGKLFYKDNGGVVQIIATKGTGVIGGSNTQVQYNSSGALAGSSNFTFDGTTATINTLNLTTVLDETYGGTGLTSYTTGDLIYASASNTLAKLAIGSNTYILTSTGSAPQWSAPSAVSVATATNLAGGTAGAVPYQSGAGTTVFLSVGTANQVMTSTGSAPQWSSGLSLTTLSTSGNTTLGDAAADNLTVNATVTSNLIFTDNTYDIGANGATRPRTIYAATSIFVPLLDATNVEVTNIKANDGTAAITITDSTGAVGISTAVTMSATTQNIALGTSQTSGTFTVGGASQTGTQTFDQSTKTHTLNIGAGATENAATKTINIGTSGVSGSTTAINIGSTNGTTVTVNGTVNATTVNVTTLDLTNLEVTNIKAKDGTASITLADSTGVASFTANPVLSGGTANGVLYLNASKVATSGSALTFDGNWLTSTYPSAGFGELGLQARYSGSFSTVGLGQGSNGVAYLINNHNAALAFGSNATEQMRLTTTGLKSSIAGSNSDPVFSYTSDTNTGIFFPAADKLGFVAGGGSDQMVLTTTGLGIGTNAPAGRLDVTGATYPVYLRSTNQQVMQVRSSSTQTNPLAANPSILLINESATNNNFTTIANFSANGATTSAVNFITVNHTTGEGILTFGTTNSSSSAAERVRIDSSGTLILRQSSNAANTSVSFNTTVQNALTLDSSGNLLSSAGATSTPSTSNSSLAFTGGGYATVNNVSAGIFGAIRGVLLLGGNYTGGTGNDTGQIKFLYGPRSTTSENTASIASIAALNTATDSTSGGVLTFNTAPTSGSTTERGRFSSDGTFRVKGAGTAGSTDAVQFSGSAPASSLILDSSGNAGLNATSISSVGTDQRVIQINADKYATLRGSGTTGTPVTYELVANSLSSWVFFGSTTNHPLLFATNNTEKMRLDSSGNLGLGVTPSAWGTYKAIQVNYLGISGSTGDGGVSFNGFYNGSTWKFIDAGQATLYNQYQGQHRFFNSNNVSGSANGDWTPTQAMTLDASGDLVVGDTSTGSIRISAVKSNPTRGILAHVYNIGSSGLTGAQIQFTQNTIDNWVIGQPAATNAFAFWVGRNVASDGAEVGRFTSGGIFCIGNGETAASPSNGVLSATGGSGTNIAGASLTIRGGASTGSGDGGAIIFATAAAGASGTTVRSAAERARIDSSGNLVGAGTTSVIYWEGVYNNTTASAANMFVASNGSFARSTSALKYKQDVRDLEAIDVSKIRPVRYKSKCENDDQTKDHFGVIADEVDAAGIKELINYGADGEVEGFQYERLTVVLLKELQSLRARVAQLESKGA